MKTPNPPDGRQYRYIETRMESSPEAHKLEGYFAVFGSEYEMWPGYRERIDPHAFDETLQSDSGDIRCLWNHNADIVLGRTGNGTLRLRVDERGLFGEVDLNKNDSDAMNAKARIERGDVSQCSFGFEIEEQDIEEREDGVTFIIRKAKLWEVSPVTFPAYQETSVSARKAEAKNLIRAKHLAWKTRMKARLRNGA